MNKDFYIHGFEKEEQDRLALMNTLLNDKCLSKLKMNGTEHVLDIGCGLGQFSRSIARKLEERKGRVVGVEKETDQFKQAIALASRDNEPGLVEFRLGSAYELPLLTSEWGTFDLVHMRFLLEHLHDRSKALSQAHLALGDGGRIVLCDDDHSNFVLAPECKGFIRLWDVYCKVFEARGNDPLIGRRLVTLLHDSGFKGYYTDMIFYGSCQSQPDFRGHVENLLGVLQGTKRPVLQQRFIYEEDFIDCINEIQEWATKPDAAIWYSLNWAEGVK